MPLQTGMKFALSCSILVASLGRPPEAEMHDTEQSSQKELCSGVRVNTRQRINESPV